MARPEPGSYRRRLAKILAESFPVMRNTPVTWKAVDIYGAQGIWRQKKMDVQLWNATCRDAKGDSINHIGCWESMGECIKAGALELSNDGYTVSPITTGKQHV